MIGHGTQLHDEFQPFHILLYIFFIPAIAEIAPAGIPADGPGGGIADPCRAVIRTDDTLADRDHIILARKASPAIGAKNSIIITQVVADSGIIPDGRIVLRAGGVTEGSISHGGIIAPIGVIAHGIAPIGAVIIPRGIAGKAGITHPG